MSPRKEQENILHKQTPQSPTTDTTCMSSPTNETMSSPTVPTTPVATRKPSTLRDKLAQRNPTLKEKIEQMRLIIAPIVHVETGIPPPDFPTTMLQLFLLTEAQLDTMAHYYSQSQSHPSHQFSSPSSSQNFYSSPNKFAYPQTMDWDRPILAKPKPGEPPECTISDYERLRIKMRMFARFIGMRGAETPTWEYERQVEVLRAKIDYGIRMEERMVPRKWFRGPGGFPW